MPGQGDLREKLLKQELENLEATLHNLESLGYSMDGVGDILKKFVKKAGEAGKSVVKKAEDAGKSVVKRMTGEHHKDAKEVFDMLHKGFPGTEVNKNGSVLTLHVNSHDVEVKEVEGVWAVVVDGKAYPANTTNADKLKEQIKNYTTSMSSGEKMHEVMRCSRAILLSQRCLASF